MWPSGEHRSQESHSPLNLPRPLCHQPASPHSSTPQLLWSLFSPYSFAFSRMSYKWNHTEACFLCLGSLTSRMRLVFIFVVARGALCSLLLLSGILLHAWVSLSLFTSWRTFVKFLIFDNNYYSHYRYSHTGLYVCMNMDFNFFWVNTRCRIAES